MPIFEFRCLECGHLLEKLFVRSDEGVDMVCPECRSPSLERVISRTTHTMAPRPGENQPKLTTRSCGGPSNQCMTLDLPGHTR